MYYDICDLRDHSVTNFFLPGKPYCSRRSVCHKGIVIKIIYVHVCFVLIIKNNFIISSFVPITTHFFFTVDRLHSFVKTTLSSEHKTPLQLPQGLSSVGQELSELCGALMRLIAHNRAVFGPHYSDIIESLMKKTDESPTT